MIKDNQSMYSLIAVIPIENHGRYAQTQNAYKAWNSLHLATNIQALYLDTPLWDFISV